MKNFYYLIFIISFIALSNLQLSIAQTVTINDASWDQKVDVDNDTYDRSRRLKITITASQTINTYLRIYLDEPPYTLLYNSEPGLLTLPAGQTLNYLPGFGTPSVTGEFEHGTYSFCIYIYNTSGTLIATRCGEQDADLNNEKFETAAEDEPVTTSINMIEPANPLVITQGTFFNITWQGSGATGSTVSLYRDPDNNWNNGNHILIASGLPQTGSYTWHTDNVPLGTYYIVGALDNEHDYANGTVTIGRPDLVVTNPSAPSSANPGQTIQVSCIVQNIGTSYAGSSTLGYYLASTPSGTDYSLGNDPVSSLDPGASSSESEQVVIPTTISAGSYYLVFKADINNNVNESNEDNNFNNVPINIIIPSVQITVTTNPSGRTITVEGNTYTAPQTFSWTPGTSHSIGTTSPQDGTTGTRYIFSNWSDGGSQTHNITVPSSPTTYTANFNTQYYLTMSANPSNGGTVSPQSGWQNAGSSIPISPSPNSGWYFTGWSGSGSGSYSGSNPSANIIMNGPISQTANFEQNPTITVTSNPNGRSITVDGNTYTAPQTFSWTPGSSHSIGTTSPQSGGTGTQYLFSNWSDGGSQTHNITVPSTPTNYTVNFTTQYYLTMTANPSNGGIVSPQSGWKDAGSSIQILASTNGGWYFTSWTGSGSGSYSGSNNPAQLTSMNGPISETANFSQIPTITITTNPSGRSITVDGNAYTAPQAFNWTPGTSHQIGTNTPQAGTTNTQYIWSNWSDGGAINHSITVPSSNTTYTANFTTQYYLTMSANPSNGGNVSPQSGWHDAGSSVQILANPNNNWDFDGWEGIGDGSYNGLNNPYNIIMNGPISETGKFKVKVGIEELEFVSGIPTDYSLFNNYPNPFNPSTYIEFGLPEESITQLKVYDILGNEVAVLLDNETVPAGRFRYEFSANNLPSGIYLYVLSSQSNVSKQSFRTVKKMLLLK